MPFLVSLLVGLSGATAVVIQQAKSAGLAAAATGATPVPIAASGARADSTHTDSAHADSAHAVRAGAAAAPTAPATAHGRRSSGVPAVPTAARHVVHDPASASTPATPTPVAAAPMAAGSVAAGSAPAMAPATTPALGGTAGSPERRLAKFLGAMPAKDAARILEQMDDRDIQTILGEMGDRQAAAVLGNLAPPRAAAVGRATLGRTARAISTAGKEH